MAPTADGDEDEGHEGEERRPGSRAAPAQRARPTASSTGSRKATTIQEAWPAVSREARVEEAVAAHGRGEEQAQVLGEEEGREGGHEGAEGQEGQEGQEEPGEAQADEVVAQLLVVEELPGQPEDDGEEREATTEADAPEERGAAGRRPARGGARGCGPPAKSGREEPGEGRTQGVVTGPRRSPGGRCRR